MGPFILKINRPNLICSNVFHRNIFIVKNNSYQFILIKRICVFMLIIYKLFRIKNIPIYFYNIELECISRNYQSHLGSKLINSFQSLRKYLSPSI